MEELTPTGLPTLDPLDTDPDNPYQAATPDGQPIEEPADAATPATEPPAKKTGPLDLGIDWTPGVPKEAPPLDLGIDWGKKQTPQQIEFTRKREATRKENAAQATELMTEAGDLVNPGTQSKEEIRANLTQSDELYKKAKLLNPDDPSPLIGLAMNEDTRGNGKLAAFWRGKVQEQTDRKNKAKLAPEQREAYDKYTKNARELNEVSSLYSGNAPDHIKDKYEIYTPDTRGKRQRLVDGEIVEDYVGKAPR
ncbi:uncharacterized protein METZ01_LOCUS439002, partial [marine metagenome]